jgi:DNA-binding MarR family transcriptional regulator
VTEQQPERDRLIAEVRATGEMVAKAFAQEQLEPILASTLTMQQLRLVTLLWTHGPLGGHELAQRLGVSMPTVSGIVDRLVERGMVERREDPTDRRVRLTALSSAGEAFVAEHDAAGWKLGLGILGTMEVEDLRALARGLTAMWAAVEARQRGDAGPRGWADGSTSAPPSAP